MKHDNYTIALSHYRYAVRWVQPSELEHDYGECDSNQRTIRIARTSDQKRVLQVKLHEYIHAIEGVYGLDLGEQTVDTLAAGLSQILRGRGVDPWKV